jgi:hypothetical protein
LLVAAALATIVLMPLLVELLGRYFHVDAHMRIRDVAWIVIVMIIGPLAAGMVVRHIALGFAERIVKPVSMFANILLVLVVLPVLFNLSQTIWGMIGNGVLVVLALFTLVVIDIGHFPSWPQPRQSRRAGARHWHPPSGLRDGNSRRQFSRSEGGGVGGGGLPRHRLLDLIDRLPDLVQANPRGKRGKGAAVTGTHGKAAEFAIVAARRGKRRCLRTNLGEGAVNGGLCGCALRASWWLDSPSTLPRTSSRRRCPYQSVKAAPSLPIRLMLGVR